MKKKAMLMWIFFVVCVIATVGLRYISDRQNVEFEEVTVTVLDAEQKELINRKTHSTYIFNEITVEYEGEKYELKNAHSVYEYPIGKDVTAYLAHGKLYANVEGVETSTPLFYAYFAFLVASFVMLGIAINESVQSRRR